MDPLFLGLIYLFLRNQGQKRPQAQARPIAPPPPPEISQRLRRELEQLVSPTLAVGLARWAALFDVKPDSGGAPWLGVEITSSPPPATVAARIVETHKELLRSVENTSPKPLGTTDEDKLWWAYAGWLRPEMFVAIPSGNAREVAKQLATMNLPDADRLLLNKANWIAFGSKVA